MLLAGTVFSINQKRGSQVANAFCTTPVLLLLLPLPLFFFSIVIIIVLVVIIQLHHRQHHLHHHYHHHHHHHWLTLWSPCQFLHALFNQFRHSLFTCCFRICCTYSAAAATTIAHVLCFYRCALLSFGDQELFTANTTTNHHRPTHKPPLPRSSSALFFLLFLQHTYLAYLLFSSFIKIIHISNQCVVVSWASSSWLCHRRSVGRLVVWLKLLFDDDMQTLHKNMKFACNFFPHFHPLWFASFSWSTQLSDSTRYSVAYEALGRVEHDIIYHIKYSHFYY